MTVQMQGLERLELKLANCWKELLSDPLTKSIEAILCGGDGSNRKLYALWLCQVAHLTRHTSAHQALVGIRVGEISLPYAKFCFEHAAEEVGHEMMAVHDLRKIGIEAKSVDDLPPPLAATRVMTSYLYYVAERAHPATRLGFSYWAEKCYPFISELAGKTKAALELSDRQMSFFVSHAEIDEKHARDVERIIGLVCQTEEDWRAVEQGMVESLNLAKNIFAEIYQEHRHGQMQTKEFLNTLDRVQQ
jgi:hypothetical protein